MREHVEDRPELLDTPLRRSRRVADDRRSADPSHAARQPPVRAHEAHRLGETRRLTFDHGAGALGGLVPWREASAAGGDDQPGESVSSVGPTPWRRPRRRQRSPRGPRPRTLRCGQLLDERPPAGVVAGPGDDPVADRQHLGVQVIGAHSVVTLPEPLAGRGAGRRWRSRSTTSRPCLLAGPGRAPGSRHPWRPHRPWRRPARRRFASARRPVRNHRPGPNARRGRRSRLPRNVVHAWPARTHRCRATAGSTSRAATPRGAASRRR